MRNHEFTQLFHRIEQVLTCLFHQYFAQQHAQRTHIPAQRLIFHGIAGRGDQFRQTGRLVVSLPE
jgi:hypothetical protein